jgi:hypothetical protein
MVKYSVFNLDAAVKLKNGRHICQCFEIKKISHSQTAIARQFDGDNLFFKVLIERTKLTQSEVLKATLDTCALTLKTGQYKLRLA